MSHRLGFGIVVLAATLLAGCQEIGIAGRRSAEVAANSTPDGWPIGNSIGISGNALSITNDRSREVSVVPDNRGDVEASAIDFGNERLTLIRGPLHKEGAVYRPRLFTQDELLSWREKEEKRLKRTGQYRRIYFGPAVHRVRNGSGTTDLSEFPCLRWEYTLGSTRRVMLLFKKLAGASAVEAQSTSSRRNELLLRRVVPFNGSIR